MSFDGQAVSLKRRNDGYAQMHLDLAGESVNKFNQLTVKEMGEALDALDKMSDVKGLLITSGKNVFVVGADITEFVSRFDAEEAEIATWAGHLQNIGKRFEDLPYPSVALFNGYALGGGLEVFLGCTYRVASTEAVVGQPEVKLGIIPGGGGCVRLPRLIGADNAIDLIASGREVKADEALKLGVVSAVVAQDKLEAAALSLLENSLKTGEWKALAEQKKQPLRLNGIERLMTFNVAKGFVAAKAGKNYPAPVESIKVMEKGADKERDEALLLEAQGFAKMAKTSAARSLVGIFLSDQFLKKKAKTQAKAAKPVASGGVLGAGIMGGGIAYQSASKGVPVIMKDIRQEAIEQGMGEASRLLAKLVGRGKITNEKMAQVMGAIQGTLSYGDFANVDLAVEAVVENIEVKRKVLADLEAVVGDDTVIATNTSTISVDELAKALKKPERFVGMHFFNPVHRMPLVEVIRGEKSSPEAIAATVGYAAKMGKTPIVVGNCAGFLVNRILGTYMVQFHQLVTEGVDIQSIDKAMEKFGWPMGPAFLSDVVGLDTAYHSGQVMVAAFPERAMGDGPSPIQLLYDKGHYGQKNGKGFYEHTTDRKGKPQKAWEPSVMDLLKPSIKGGSEGMDEATIVDRMMLPMLWEAVRCLDEKIVDTSIELDMSMIMGLGFPPFRGGLLAWADSEGLNALIQRSEAHAGVSTLYAPPASAKDMAAGGKTFHSWEM